MTLSTSAIKKLLLKVPRALGLAITKYHASCDERCVSLQTKIPPKATVLIAYILEPFLLKPGEPVSTAHTHHWESLLIADTFLDLGYSVDVIHYRNDSFVPQKNYAFFVSARTNFERLAKLLNPDCIKIAHMDTAHFAFNNAAAYQRVLGLQHRRGMTSASIRILPHNLALECADFAAVLGGEFALDTYRYANKRLFPLRLPTVSLYEPNDDKDYEKCRRHFLWFGSGGLVHKGLDLVLEAFLEMPEYHLTVCGPIQDDEHFQAMYYKELYRTPNIKTIGWVDVSSSTFLQIANNCVALIFPSCSESQSASSLPCMQASLIPILSYEAGIDVHDFGVILRESSVAAIIEAVRDVSKLSAARLRQMSRKAWEYARTNHTRENYKAAYRDMLETIIAARV